MWLRFPSDWAVTNAYVVGTPVCDSGSGWLSFSWSYETNPYEIRIDHSVYNTSTDHCVATYCVDATAGAGTGGAGVSWYWDGDEYGSAPHSPCSSDVYTPASMAGEPCDQAINPVASVPACSGPPCSALADVPWLSEVPTSGTTAGGSSTPVTVTFDSTGLALGTYSANLCVSSDDPTRGRATAPTWWSSR